MPSPFAVMPMPCPDNNQHLLFSLDRQVYAVPVGMVERVVRAVMVTRLAEAPAWLEGIITVRGRVVPVVSLRQRFQLPAKSIRLSDRIVICRSPRRLLAFLVDQVHDVVCLAADVREEAQAIFPQLDDFIVGACRLDDDTVLIYDFDKLLTPQEIDSLEAVLAPHEKDPC